LTLQGSTLTHPIFVQVEVSTIDNSLTASAETFLNPIAPETYFYEDHPLLGMRYERAMPLEIKLVAKEINMRAVPYFFSTKDANKNITYNWFLNGDKVSTVLGNKITVRNEGKEGATSEINLSIKHLFNQFQTTGNNITVLVDPQN
jgi:hypothetical protein